MDWDDYERQALAQLEGASTTVELSEAHVRWLGRRAELPQALRKVRDPETGRRLNALRAELEEAEGRAERRIAGAELRAQLGDETFDPTLPGEAPPVGTLHPITQVRRIVEDAFLGLGYEIRDDREVETVEYNFDKLAFPSTHSSRSPRDTFFLDRDTVLRTETSPSQIHHLEEREPPVYMVSIGRVYRRDAITATRFPIFHQFEGLAIDRDITLADLKGTLLHVMRALFGDDRQVRFRTHFFPFTEPSIEPDVSCGVCGGTGCRTCKFTGWIELGGAGMVDPEVLKNVGIDPEEYTGFAFGFGIDRLVQLLYGVDHVKNLWDGDVRFAGQF